MRQLVFPFTRYEQPGAYWSYVEDGIVIRGHVGPHSIDTAWPFWTPWSLT